MAPQEVRRMLKDSPFKPFRVHVSDGSAYDVLDPGDASMTALVFFVGVDPDESGLPQKAVYISPNHVSRIVPILEAKAS